MKGLRSFFPALLWLSIRSRGWMLSARIHANAVSFQPLFRLAAQG
jgi:hypothetical protein